MQRARRHPRPRGRRRRPRRQALRVRPADHRGLRAGLRPRRRRRGVRRGQRRPGRLRPANIAGYVVSAAGARGRPPGAAGAEPDLRRSPSAATAAADAFPDVDKLRDHLGRTSTARRPSAPRSVEVRRAARATRSSSTSSTGPAARPAGATSCRRCATHGVKILEFDRRAREPRRPAAGHGDRGLVPRRSSCCSPTSTTRKFAEEGGSSVERGTYIQSPFPTFEMADENKATQDYLDLMEQYNPDGQGRPARHAGPVGVPALRHRRPRRAAPTSPRECLLEQAAAQDGVDRRRAARAARPPGNATPPSASSIIGLDADGFVYDEEATGAERGHLQLRPGERLRADRRLRSAAAGRLTARLDAMDEFLASDRHRPLHRRHLRAGGQRPRPHLHDHRHLQLRPRRDRDARAPSPTGSCTSTGGGRRPLALARRARRAGARCSAS